jgi:hypothetical protein
MLHTRGWPQEQGKPEERFEALLGAAGVFMGGVHDGSPHHVEEIYPTLRMAHKIGEQGIGMYSYSGVRLSDVVEGVPVIEQPPVRVSSPQASRNAPFHSYVVVQIGAHSKAIVAEDIAEAYRGSLMAAEEPWGGKGGGITYGFHGDSLQVEVERGEFSTQDDGSLWPSPPTVGRAVAGILEEFADELQLRKRSGEIKLKNLIPAIVAHLLRATLLNSPFARADSKTDRKKIQRLLEERLYRQELGTILPKAWTQIWRDADKVAAREDLYGPGPMRLWIGSSASIE